MAMCVTAGGHKLERISSSKERASRETASRGVPGNSPGPVQRSRKTLTGAYSRGE